MVHRKVKYKVIGYFFFCAAVLFSCKKESKDPINVSMNAILAHNNQPVSGIKWHISEAKGGGLGSDQEVTDWEMSGETDQNGVSIFQFKPLKDKSYYYDISFDYSSMNVPSGDYSVVSGPSSFARLDRGKTNDYEIRILPKMDVNIHFKNVNCYDNQDSFKFKYYNIDEYPNHSQGQINSIPWFEGSAYNGCLEMNWNGLYLAGHYVFYWEATRNGILETGIDTFYVSPDGNNLIEMFW